MEISFKRRWNSTSSILLALVVLGALQTSQAANVQNSLLALECDGLLRPYRANYDVYRNGKLIGISTSELSRETSGSWLYQVLTEATKGMTGFLGGRIQESARLTEVAGVMRPEHYDLTQKVAFSKVKRSADFDWQQKRAHGKNKRKQWQLDLQGDESDRLSANLIIRQQLAAGKTQLSFRTIEKGELRVRDFEAREIETVVTGLGEMPAIPVHRKHGNAKRTTVTWHAPQLAYLAVRVEHAKQGDDSGKMILKEFTQQDCTAPSGPQLAE